MVNQPTISARIIVAVTLGLGVLGASVPGAQQKPPTFRTAARLVEVTVSVLDNKGNAVPGLGPEDFVLLDAGRPRPVELVRFDGAPAAAPAAAAMAPALPAGTFSNRPVAGDPAARNITALVLDHITTTPQQAVTAKALMMRYLSLLVPHTTTAVYLMADKLYVLHEFSDDAAALRARLERLNLPPPTAWEMDYRKSIVEAEAFVEMFADAPDPATKDAMVHFMRYGLRMEALADAAIRRDWMERSLASIEAVGAHLAGIPARKNVIWIGGGLTWVSITASRPIYASQPPFPEVMETFEDKVRQLARRLAQHGSVLYFVDARHLEAPSDTTAQSARQMPLRGRGNFETLMDTQAVSSDTRAPMQAMTSITGGRYFYPTDSTGVSQVVSDLQGSYTLGFTMPEPPDGKWHSLKVQVKRRGLNVRHRNGYLADASPAQPGKWTDDMWRTPLSNPLGSSAIPLTAQCKRTASGELAITVLADTSALHFLEAGETLKASLEVLIADRTAEGPGRVSRFDVTSVVPAGEWDERRQQPMRYDATWTPGAGTTSLRVIVHDVNSGRHGSVDVPLHKVPRERPD